jgi:hypothetical protein
VEPDCAGGGAFEIGVVLLDGGRIDQRVGSEGVVDAPVLGEELDSLLAEESIILAFSGLSRARSLPETWRPRERAIWARPLIPISAYADEVESFRKLLQNGVVHEAFPISRLRRARRPRAGFDSSILYAAAKRIEGDRQ